MPTKALLGKKQEKPRTSGWQITCDQTCGFMVRDRDRNELVKRTQLPMATSHQQKITEEAAMRMAEAAADEV